MAIIDPNKYKQLINAGLSDVQIRSIASQRGDTIQSANPPLTQTQTQAPANQPTQPGTTPRVIHVGTNDMGTRVTYTDPTSPGGIATRTMGAVTNPEQAKYQAAFNRTANATQKTAIANAWKAAYGYDLFSPAF